MTTTGIIALAIGLAIVAFIVMKLQKNKTTVAETGKDEKLIIPPKNVAQNVAEIPSITSTEKSSEKQDDAVFAAISLALHLYLNDQHDVESNVITIKRIQKRYSPWSSKIYSMNNFQ